MTLLRDRLAASRQWLLDWNTIDHNAELAHRIDQLQPSLDGLEAERQQMVAAGQRLMELKGQITGQINMIQYQLQVSQQTKGQIEVTQTDITRLEGQLRVIQEYERVFNRTHLPFQLMNLKLNSFNQRINEIFAAYTKYSFQYDQSDKGKLIFLVTDRTNGCVTEPDRLSGFESVILQLAINQAMLSISNRFRSGLMVVDESLDCIDQHRFVQQLPTIMEAIRKYYQVVILISHREVPATIIDKQLKITVHGDGSCEGSIYSTINES